jgi:hypothetical protein
MRAAFKEFDMETAEPKLYHIPDGEVLASQSTVSGSDTTDSREIRGGTSGTGVCSTLIFFGFPLIIIIPLLPHIHTSSLHKFCDGPYQAAHYHILDH